MREYKKSLKRGILWALFDKKGAWERLYGLSITASGEEGAVGGDGEGAEGEGFSAFLQCGFCCVLQPAAAGNLHAHNGYAVYII